MRREPASNRKEATDMWCLVSYNYFFWVWKQVVHCTSGKQNKSDLP
jgi:hypothetical protein